MDDFTKDEEIKILILMSYFNRPILVKNAINSIIAADQYHKNWELVFFDDNSPISGKPIVESLMPEHMLERVTFLRSSNTLEDKLINGLELGKYANQSIKKSEADVAIMLSDDDELSPYYLGLLNMFYKNNPNILHAYSKVHLYNPIFQKSSDVHGAVSKYNRFNDPINPAGNVDSSQVSWRLRCCKEFGAWFPETTNLGEGKPWVKDTDRSFFEALFSKCGPCHPTGFMGQYKGVHDYQLVWHKNATSVSLEQYIEGCLRVAGEKI